MSRLEALRPQHLARPRWLASSWWLVVAVVLLALAGVLRYLLHFRFPIFFTNDSGEYLRAAERIALELDFMSLHLRDWRMPGYPVFLALLSWLAEWSSASIVAAQKIGGLLCAVLGFTAAAHLGWRVGAILVGAFLAFHPVYLLNEHLAMSEALFTLLLWVFATVCVLSLGRGPGFARGLLLGTAFSACILTRAPGMFFCAPVLAGVVLFELRSGDEGWPARRSRLLFLGAGLLLAVAALVGPWSYRNYLMYGRLSPFTNNLQRTLVSYMNLHQVLDPELPEVRRFEETENPRTKSGQVVKGLGSGVEGEQKAARIVRDQLREHKGKYLARVGFSLWRVLGLPASTHTPGSTDVSFWFRAFARDVDALRRHNLRIWGGSPTFTYVDWGRQGRVLDRWADAGVFYLRWGRGLLTVVFVLAVVVHLVHGGFLPRERERAAVLVVAAGFLSAAVCHAILLSDKERYAVLWDGFQVFVVAGAVELAIRRWRSRRAEVPHA